MQRVNPWHLTESYSVSQLLGKAVHELRFWLYDKFPYVASAYCHYHMPSSPVELSVDIDTSKLDSQSTENTLNSLLDNFFVFAGERHHLSQEGFWQPQGASRLFTFSLHYLHWFHDLVKTEDGAARARDHLDDWIKRNRLGLLEGWHPYVISRRLVSLMGTWHVLVQGQPKERVRRWLRSIHEQTTFLNLHKEDFLGGNHLMENYVALLCASLFLSQRDNLRLIFQDTTVLLEEELSKQILKDGGHCEGSYGYHMELLARLQFLCRVLRAAGRSIPHWLTQPMNSMEEWARTLTAHLDEPPIFGDSWRSAPIATRDEDGPQRTVRHLLESSLLRIQWKDAKDVIIFRYGSFGGPGVPGHGHCDCTSYELFLGGHPFVCDSGNLHYRNDNLRQYFRSTKAHNVAYVENVEQSEFSHTFRAGKTAKGKLGRLKESDERISFCMYYEPSTEKGRGIRFVRNVIIIPTRAIIVCDTVEGLPDCELSSYVHLVPDAARAEADKDLQQLFSQGRTMWLCLLSGLGTRTEKGHYAPNFGDHHSTIVCRLTGRERIVYALTVHKPTTREKKLWNEMMTNLLRADKSE